MPTQTQINREKYTFCVIKSFEQLKNWKNGPVLCFGQKLIIHVIKSQIHLGRQYLYTTFLRALIYFQIQLQAVKHDENWLLNACIH